MRQQGGRAKALKARQSLDDLTGLTIVNPVAGDLLVYNGVDWVNTQTLSGAYTFQDTITALDADFSGAVSAASLDVAGTISANAASITGGLSAGSASLASATISGNASVGGDLTVAGTLDVAGFSVSGTTTFTGAVAMSSTLSVADDVTLGADLTVAGLSTLNSLVVTGNAIIGGNETIFGNLSVSGEIAGAGLSIAGNAGIGGQLVLGAGATYTQDSISFINNGQVVFLNGDTTILSLETVGLVQVTGNPNGQLDMEGGSLAVRDDSYDPNAVLYIKTGSGVMGWNPVRDCTQDFEWCFLQIQMLKEALTNVLNADGSVGVFIEGD